MRQRETAKPRFAATINYNRTAERFDEYAVMPRCRSPQMNPPVSMPPMLTAIIRPYRVFVFRQHDPIVTATGHSFIVILRAKRGGGCSRHH